MARNYAKQRAVNAADPQPELIIVGGGLAGCLAALALVERRPDVSLLLLEQGDRFGGNHVWSFFDTDVAPASRALLAPLVTRHWPDHQVHFPKRSRSIAIGYNSIRSTDLDRVLRQRLGPARFRLNCRIEEVGERHVRLVGERIEAGAIIDARGATHLPGLELGWQKFVGRTYRFDRPHGCLRPVIMDATVDQSDGYRFLYRLPFSDTELMLEDTYYSESPALDRETLGEGLDVAAGSGAVLLSEEAGLLPVVLGGDVESLWPSDEPPVARLGVRGGFFHPTTSYSLPDAVRNAELLCEQTDLSSRALHRFFKGRAEALWTERRFFQLLNRMLFDAAEPSRRYAVLEHFYRLPDATVARFYAARLTAFDKLRILSGRPPVPIGRALAAMRRRAA